MVKSNEKNCPKCKGLMHRMGRFTNEVILNVNENGSPEYFENEVENYKTIYNPDEIFWQCENCNYKEEIKDGKL